MSALRIGPRLGGRQAPRREALFAVRYGRGELAATVLSALMAALAWYVVGVLGLTTSEAMARTVRLGTLWDGYDTSLAAFGFDRPPLLSVLAAPFAAFEGLRVSGLAAALGTALASGLTVIVSAGLARRAGFARVPLVLFVVAFSCNPLLVYAGALGLPEAIYASLVMMSLSEFGMWIEKRDVGSVIGAGVALGVAFLLRYNVVLVIAAMAFGFWWLAREERRSGESEVGPATLIAFLGPTAFIVGLWTLLAWFPRGDEFGYLRLAHELTLLGNEDLDVLARMADLRGNLLGVGAWLGGWVLLMAPLSVLAVGALLVEFAYDRSRSQLALAIAFAGLVLPEAVAVLSGSGQALLPHLFVVIVPAFVYVALREREFTRGVPPGPLEGPRRRAQLAWTGALFLCSMWSAAALWFMPGRDAVDELVAFARTGEAPQPAPGDALATARFIREQTEAGGVLVDVERHAQVMLLTGPLWHFQTDADQGEEATLYEPFESVEYVLVRRRLAGQGEGRIERAYGDVFVEGDSSFSLSFESGDYRLYSVTGPALP